MMKYTTCFLPVLLAFYVAGARQQPGDTVDYYIAHLNWNSTLVTTTWIERFELASDAKRLVNINSEGMEEKLYAHIGDTEKTVAIHAILSWRHKDTIRFGMRGRYHYPDSMMLHHVDLL